MHCAHGLSKIKLLASGVPLLLLTSCIGNLERADIRLHDSMLVDVSGTAFFGAKDGGEDKVAPEIEKCSGSKVIYTRDTSNGKNGVRFSADWKNLSAGTISEIQRCFVNSEFPVVLTPRKSSGILSDEYIIDFEIIEGNSGRTRGYVPKLLYVSMPGDDLHFEETSRTKFLDTSFEEISSSEAKISLTVKQSVRDEATKAQSQLCPNGASTCPAEKSARDRNEWPITIPVKFRVTSVHYKYGINELMAILGLLFGSGFVFGAQRWFRSKGQSKNSR